MTAHSIIHFIGFLSEIKWQNPAQSEAEKQIESVRVVFLTGIKIEIAAAAGKALSEFKACVKIDKTISAKQLVTNKLLQSQSISKPIVAFFVFVG